MRKLEISEIKKKELELLKKLTGVIEKLNLKYSLAGGTLLGAVRHKGFIPWDDDIDILMPRNDYNLLIEYFKKNSIDDMKMICHELDENYKNLSSKVSDCKTKLIEHNVAQEVEYGIFIDVFPVDALGDDFKTAKNIFKKTRFKRYLLVASNWGAFKKSLTRPWYQETIRFIFYLLSRNVNSKKLIKKIEKHIVNNKFEDVNYVGAVSGSYDSKEIMEKSIFDKYIDIQFEGEYFKAVADYDRYLTAIYGDYMVLPPVDKRVTRHDFDVYEI